MLPFDFKGKQWIYVKCHTKKEVKALFRLLKPLKIRWSDGGSLKISEVYWEESEEHTIYCIRNNGVMVLGNVFTTYTGDGTVYLFEDFMEEYNSDSVDLTALISNLDKKIEQMERRIHAQV